MLFLFRRPDRFVIAFLRVDWTRRREVPRAGVLGVLLFVGAALLLGGAPRGAAAQTVPDDDAPPPDDSTREGRLRQQRQQKEAGLTAPERGFFSQTVTRVESFIEENQLVIDLPEVGLYGLQPVLGGLRSGSGTTGGLRLPFFRGRDDVDSYVEALASLKRYYGAEGVIGYDLEGAWTTYGFARYWHLPEENFYGVGPEAEEIESNYHLDDVTAGGLVGYELLPRVLVGGHVSYQLNRYGRGRDDDHPPIEQAFFEENVPGLGADVDYAVPGGFLEYDSRNIPYETDYARRFAPTERRLRGISLDATSGFYAAVEALPHVALGTGNYDYTRFNFESQQYIPFRDGFQVLALREFLTLTSTPGVNTLPFYEMETLGGEHTLRGYDTFRFRDHNAILLNAEYRWQIFRPLDMALFVDAGHVFGAVEELALKAEHFETAYGVGLRIMSGQRVIGRFDVAYGGAGLTTNLELGGVL
ncbi:MAG: hypothetical protein BRD46_00435 [Bacteroidetes bacterium QS_8_68_15]|nr:MAG: hypothetical protein BRD46_00435 [Bacteroidetes bacterium QS_8_68_15]